MFSAITSEILTACACAVARDSISSPALALGLSQAIHQLFNQPQDQLAISRSYRSQQPADPLGLVVRPWACLCQQVCGLTFKDGSELQ